METFKALITHNKEWLMTRGLPFAAAGCFSQDTADIPPESQHLPPEGLYKAFLEAIESGILASPVPTQETGGEPDPAANFGMMAARKDPDCNGNLGMFLGLLKYYRKSYKDLIEQAGFDAASEKECALLVNRFFDRVEIGFCSEWAAAAERSCKQAEENRIKAEKLQETLKKAGVICHELNQPLQVTLGLSQLAMMQMAQEDPLYEKLQKICSHVDKMGSITQQLSQITKF